MPKFIIAIALLISLFSCTSNDTVSTNQPNLSNGLQADYLGILSVSYSDFPDRNTSESTVITVFEVDTIGGQQVESTVRVDSQGGDSFVCTLEGNASTPEFDEVLSTTGIYNAGSITVNGGFSIASPDISLTYSATMPFAEGGTFTISFQGNNIL